MLQQAATQLSLARTELEPTRRDVNRVNDQWFAHTDAVREKIGLTDPDEADVAPARPSRKVHAAAWSCGAPVVCSVTEGCPVQTRCGICFDSFGAGSTATCGGACNHHFCKDCWRQYVHTAINNGPAVLSLRCPEPSCKAAVRPPLRR